MHFPNCCLGKSASYVIKITTIEKIKKAVLGAK